jgi:hypothetical protein
LLKLPQSVLNNPLEMWDSRKNAGNMRHHHSGQETPTHTRPETLRQQVEQALRRWPESLKYALERSLDRPG